MAIDVLKRAKNPKDPKSVLASIKATNYHSIVGPVHWTGQPVKNVTKTPLVAGQWQRQKDGKFDLVITENKSAPQIPVGGKLKPIGLKPTDRPTSSSPGRRLRASRPGIRPSKRTEPALKPARIVSGGATT